MRLLDVLKYEVFFNYFNFTGRTRRVDYWWYRLAYLIILFGPTVIVALIFGDSDIFGDSETKTTTLLGTEIGRAHV